MMWLVRKVRPLVRQGTRVMGSFHDPLEHATGLEKREMLAHLAGNCDPYNMLPRKKGPGTFECPNLIPSAFNKRLIGCDCNEKNNHLVYMWLHMGHPKRCYCGYWFVLCPVAPL